MGRCDRQGVGFRLSLLDRQALLWLVASTDANQLPSRLGLSAARPVSKDPSFLPN